MSKFFQIFEKLERRPVSVRGNNSHRTPLFATDRNRGELQRIVTRLYLDALAPAPQVMLFSVAKRKQRGRWVAAQLADLLAVQQTASVCLIEIHPAGPSLRERLGLPVPLPRCELPAEAPADIHQFAVKVPATDLWLLAIGSSEEGEDRVPAGRMIEQMPEIRRRFQFVVIDDSTGGISPESLELARMADGVVLMLEPGTRRETAFRRKEALEAAAAKILGVILVDHSLPVPKLVSHKT